MRRSTNGRRLVVIAVGALLISACGGGDSGGDTGEDAPGAATSFTVQGNEFTFTPDAWTVAADTDVTVTFENVGAIVHDWVVLKAGTDIISEAEFSENLVETEVRNVPAGSSGTVTLNLPSGTYQVICAIPGHFAAGMEGSLTVTSG